MLHYSIILEDMIKLNRAIVVVLLYSSSQIVCDAILSQQNQAYGDLVNQRPMQDDTSALRSDDGLTDSRPF
ncbi:unnamed protein product [Ilex paraguariensis]|uniref:Uncharacterized protein n=1 Tax=Ilex paraguariensis TaxID=185542 RepID=A0ABC8RIQ3_9AQUA